MHRWKPACSFAHALLSVLAWVGSNLLSVLAWVDVGSKQGPACTCRLSGSLLACLAICNGRAPVCHIRLSSVIADTCVACLQDQDGFHPAMPEARANGSEATSAGEDC